MKYLLTTISIACLVLLVWFLASYERQALSSTMPSARASEAAPPQPGEHRRPPSEPATLRPEVERPIAALRLHTRNPEIASVDSLQLPASLICVSAQPDQLLVQVAGSTGDHWTVIDDPRFVRTEVRVSIESGSCALQVRCSPFQGGAPVSTATSIVLPEKGLPTFDLVLQPAVTVDFQLAMGEASGGGRGSIVVEHALLDPTVSDADADALQLAEASLDAEGHAWMPRMAYSSAMSLEPPTDLVGVTIGPRQLAELLPGYPEETRLPVAPSTVAREPRAILVEIEWGVPLDEGRLVQFVDGTTGRPVEQVAPFLYAGQDEPATHTCTPAVADANGELLLRLSPQEAGDLRLLAFHPQYEIATTRVIPGTHRPLRVVMQPARQELCVELDASAPLLARTTLRFTVQSFAAPSPFGGDDMPLPLFGFGWQLHDLQSGKNCVPMPTGQWGVRVEGTGEGLGFEPADAVVTSRDAHLPQRLTVIEAGAVKLELSRARDPEGWRPKELLAFLRHEESGSVRVVDNWHRGTSDGRRVVTARPPPLRTGVWWIEAADEEALFAPASFRVDAGNDERERQPLLLDEVVWVEALVKDPGGKASSGLVAVREIAPLDVGFAGVEPAGDLDRLGSVLAGLPNRSRTLARGRLCSLEGQFAVRVSDNRASLPSSWIVSRLHAFTPSSGFSGAAVVGRVLELEENRVQVEGEIPWDAVGLPDNSWVLSVSSTVPGAAAAMERTWRFGVALARDEDFQLRGLPPGDYQLTLQALTSTERRAPYSVALNVAIGGVGAVRIPASFYEWPVSATIRGR